MGLTVSNKHLQQINEVVLSFPFKDCVLEGGQSKDDEKRKEIFFNEVLAKDEINRLLDEKVITNAKKYTKDGLSDDVGFNRDDNGLIKDNLIIKGNNLLALHTLKSNFAGKVKLIYIDPPYNTGNDSFNYNDNFNHSTWLTFMKNRLEVARALLSDDGVIFVQLDFNEVHYCRVLLDEVFGREMFKNSIVWCYTGPAGANNFLPRKHDDILWYGKNKISQFNMPYIKHKSGVHNTGQVFGNTDSKESFKEDIESRGKKLEDWWIDIYSTDRYRKEKIIFSGQKPEKLLQRIIEISTKKGDLVLDYHLGSGTTCAVAHKMGRQYIGIEQMDYIEDIAVKRMQKVIGSRVKKDGELLDSVAFDTGGISKAVDWTGGGEFIYFELDKYNQKYIDELSNATDKTILNLYDEIGEKAFLNYDVESKKLLENKKDFATLNLNAQQAFLISILNKNQLYKNLSEMDDKDLLVDEKTKTLNTDFYNE